MALVAATGGLLFLLYYHEKLELDKWKEDVETIKKYEALAKDTQTKADAAKTQLEAGTLPAIVRSALTRHGLPPSKLVLEITERSLLAGEAARSALSELDALGVHLALDGRQVLELARPFDIPLRQPGYRPTAVPHLACDKVRFVFKNYPLTSIHSWAEDAAVASECGFQQGNDQFWTMYNGLFSKQGEINKDNLAGEAAEIAEAGGLDVAKFKECLEGKKSLDAVKADESEATALGVNSTPTFFVNGRRLSGAQTYEGFKQLIDQELGAKG